MQVISKLAVVAGLATVALARSHHKHARRGEGYGPPPTYGGLSTGAYSSTSSYPVVDPIYTSTTAEAKPTGYADPSSTTCTEEEGYTSTAEPWGTGYPPPAYESTTSSVPVAPISTGYAPPVYGGSSSEGSPVESSSAPWYPYSSSTVDAYGTGVHPETYPAPTGSYTTEVVDKTLTYTQGYGSTASVVTTTVHSTITKYLTQTLTKTKPTADATGAYGGETSYTTIKSTSTITNTITVQAATSPAAKYPATDCTAATVTKTETETVTVTAGGYSSSEAAPYSSEAAPYSSSAPAYGVWSSTADAGAYTSTPVAPAAYTTPAAGAWSSKSQSGAWYPTGSAESTSTDDCASTGFITISKPKPTGAYASPYSSSADPVYTSTTTEAPVYYSTTTSVADPVEPTPYTTTTSEADPVYPTSYATTTSEADPITPTSYATTTTEASADPTVYGEPATYPAFTYEGPSTTSSTADPANTGY